MSTNADFVPTIGPIEGKSRREDPTSIQTNCALPISFVSARSAEFPCLKRA